MDQRGRTVIRQVRSRTGVKAERVDWADIDPAAMTMSDAAVHEVRDATDEGFRVFYSSFMAPLAGMAGGTHSWVSGILSVATRTVVELWQAVAVEGDLVRARAFWSGILPVKYLYARLLRPASDLAIYRAILELRGTVVGHRRAPLLDLIAAQRDKLRAILEPAGLVSAG